MDDDFPRDSVTLEELMGLPIIREQRLAALCDEVAGAHNAEDKITRRMLAIEEEISFLFNAMLDNKQFRDELRQYRMAPIYDGLRVVSESPQRPATPRRYSDFPADLKNKAMKEARLWVMDQIMASPDNQQLSYDAIEKQLCDPKWEPGESDPLPPKIKYLTRSKCKQACGEAIQQVVLNGTDCKWTLAGVNGVVAKLSQDAAAAQMREKAARKSNSAAK